MAHNHVFVIRHGESENNLLGIDSTKLENKNQFGLSENGRKEIETEAKKYRDFDLIITSPFRRTKETAMIFVRNSQCEIIENELLKEVCVGDLELCTYAVTDAFLEKYHDESVPYPNGESLLDAKNRAMEFVHHMHQTYDNKKILIVTHGHIVLFLQEQLDPTFNRMKAMKEYDDANSRKVIDLCQS